MERTAGPTAAWRPVVVPSEHRGWGFLAEPVVLGLVLAPSAARGPRRRTRGRS